MDFRHEDAPKPKAWTLEELLDRLERYRSRLEMDGAYTDAMICMEALKALELQRLQLELHEVRELLWRPSDEGPGPTKEEANAVANALLDRPILPKATRPRYKPNTDQITILPGKTNAEVDAEVNKALKAQGLDPQGLAKKRALLNTFKKWEGI